MYRIVININTNAVVTMAGKFSPPIRNKSASGPFPAFILCQHLRKRRGKMERERGEEEEGDEGGNGSEGGRSMCYVVMYCV
jgi:hypothetical protein